ncbi:CLIP domain-containing serine protease B15-like [Armigeres subalbatus]|uniref:CLIP domain-containing serine protease B15-like n=1 Tax=Armigeres subalbatus TaxID=124917 RepID=UPI002ED12304
MKLLLIVIVYYSALVWASKLNINDSCTTPCGKPGKCVPSRSCDYGIARLRKPDPTYEDTIYLQSSICGRHPDPPHIPLTCCPALLNPTDCGLIDITKRIVGGEPTKLEEHPWAALLIYDTSGNETGVPRLVPKCGGSLLNSRYVLTAAHCIMDIPKKWKLEYVRFSEWDALSKENCTTIESGEQICRQEYAIDKIIVHPKYNKTVPNKVHDITLLRLTEDVEFSKYVRPICLPFENAIREMPIDDEDFTVTGWGQTETKIRSGIQLHVDIIGKTREVCNTKFSIANITLEETQLCVGGEKGKDSCKGDSGGPLMRLVNSVWYQVGVVSFGNRFCGTEGFPGIYTDVTKYLRWIEKEANKIHCPNDDES